jgi:hypothetical protein
MNKKVRSALWSLALLGGLLPGTVLSAQNLRTVFVDGWVDLKPSSGQTQELYVGQVLQVGDTVITGSDGRAEFEYQAGSRINVFPGTVFSVQQRSSGGQTRNAVSATVGQLAFVFNRMTGAEPDIVTPSAACGIRGTELVVYAGADGSSLIVVESGRVEVESSGALVDLADGEGVELRSGVGEPEKFNVLQGVIDYSAWNSQRTETMLTEPLSALSVMAGQLDTLLTQMEHFYAEYEQQQEVIIRGRFWERDLRDQGQKDEADRYYREELRPLELENFSTIINVRFYALSALSYKRHVLTGLYVRVKTQYLTQSQAPGWMDFVRAYGGITAEYNTRITPQLVEADI